MLVLNDRYYFNEKGEKVIPTNAEIREVHNLNNKYTVVKAEFPNEGYGIKQGTCKCWNFPYKTREEAEVVRDVFINDDVDYYRGLVR